MIKAGQYTVFIFGSNTYRLEIKNTVDTDRFELYKDGLFLNGGDCVPFVNLFSLVDRDRMKKKERVFLVKDGDYYETRLRT